MTRRQLGPVYLVEESVRELAREEKWGGGYLRAPKAYRDLLEGFRENLIPLGKLAEVRSGIRTGWNAFFYLKPIPQRPICPLCGTVHPEALTEGEERAFWEEGKAAPPGTLVAVESALGWKGYLEWEVLHPIYKKIHEVPEVPFLRLFRPEELSVAPHARAYVAWGEALGGTSGEKHNPWWRPPYLPPAPIVVPAGIHTEYRFALNLRGFTLDRRLYGIYPLVPPERLLVSLNTPIAKLSLEVMVRGNLGGGLADFTVHEYAAALVPRPDRLDRFPKKVLEEAERVLEDLIYERIRRSRESLREKKHKNPSRALWVPEPILSQPRSEK